MDIKVEKVNGIAVVAVAGELNMDNSNLLRETFKKLLKDLNDKVLLDLEKLSFMDSSGIATIIELFQDLKKGQGRLCLCCVNKRIIGVFEITKVHKLFSIFESREAALKSFA